MFFFPQKFLLEILNRSTWKRETQSDNRSRTQRRYQTFSKEPYLCSWVELKRPKNTQPCWKHEPKWSSLWSIMAPDLSRSNGTGSRAQNKDFVGPHSPRNPPEWLLILFASSFQNSWSKSSDFQDFWWKTLLVLGRIFGLKHLPLTPTQSTKIRPVGLDIRVCLTGLCSRFQATC